MVLIADDDVEDNELVKEALRRNNYHIDVITALNGQELMDALHAPGTINPQLILLDLNMPKKNGFEALQEIKADKSLTNIPVVILSSSNSMEDELLCMKLGCLMFLRKPSLMKEYDALIQRVKGFLK